MFDGDLELHSILLIIKIRGKKMIKTMTVGIIAALSLTSVDLCAGNAAEGRASAEKGLRFAADEGQQQSAKQYAISEILKDVEKRIKAYDDQVKAFGISDEVVNKVQEKLKAYKDLANACLTKTEGCGIQDVWSRHITDANAGREDIGGLYNAKEGLLKGPELAAFQRQRQVLRDHYDQWVKFCEAMDVSMKLAGKCEAQGFKGEGCSNQEVIDDLKANFEVALADGAIPELQQKESSGSEGEGEDKGAKDDKMGSGLGSSREDNNPDVVGDE